MMPFTEWIKVDNQPTEFNFRKIHTTTQDKFFISMVDSKRNSVSFDMIMNSEGKWNIIKPVREFIVLLKDLLIKLLEKHCGLQPTPLFAFDRLNGFKRAG